MENNKKFLTIIVILSVLLVGSLGYITYDKLSDKKDDTKEVKNDTKKDNNDNKENKDDKTKDDTLSITLHGGVADGTKINFVISTSTTAIETLRFEDQN